MISISTTEVNPELRFYILTTINTFNGSKNIEVVSATDKEAMARIMAEIKQRPGEGYIKMSQVVNLTLVDADGSGDWCWLDDDELHGHAEDDDDFEDDNE